ncbi:MAG: AMP-dependent synthetase/ligase [Acidimicrobiales bacterium]
MSTVSSDDIAREVEGQTLATMFLATVASSGERTALRWQHGDAWASWTWAEYGAEVARAAAGFRALGVEPGDRVVLMLRNVAEFHVLDLAAVFCGATPVSIYNSSSPDQVAYLTEHCGAKVGVVEDIGFLERFAKVRDELPELRDLVVVRDPDRLAGDQAIAWDRFTGNGSLDLEAHASLVTPDTLATVIYTSGTTGPPKGVMIDHRNVAWTAECLRLALAEASDPTGFRVVSYLPMAHIAERMTSHYAGILNGYDVACCPDPSLLGPFLREVRPDMVFGVPRVWEKLAAGVQGALAGDAEKKAGFDQAVAVAAPIAIDRSWGRSTAEQDATWDALQAKVFTPVRAMLGLDRLVLAITGAAPIPRELLEWFNATGVPLSEIYGMSENCGPMTWTPVRIKPGTVGPACPGVEVRLADDGEVLCKGGNVFRGYLNDTEKTAEALDDDAWLHTGDIGLLDEDSYLKIVDRKKELIITAGGKNISPANLEAALKSIPLIGQACAIGDQRPFVSALVVLDPEVAPAWAASHSITATSLAGLATDADVIAEVERCVTEVMAGFNNAERVKKVRVLGEEWLPDSEELTPTSKLKRRGVHAKYHDEIEALYT